VQHKDVVGLEDLFQAYGNLERALTCMADGEPLDTALRRRVHTFVEGNDCLGAAIHHSLRPALHRAGHAAVTHERTRVVAHYSQVWILSRAAMLGAAEKNDI
jgi:hypothetical protein